MNASALIQLLLFLLSGVCGPQPLVGGTTAPPGKRLIQVNEVDPPIWMSEEQLQEQRARGSLSHFIDITDYPQEAPVPAWRRSSLGFPTTLVHQALVAQIIPLLNMTRMKAFVQEFSGFNNRYYKGATGRQSSEWLQNHVHTILEESRAVGYNGTTSVQAVNHSWPQSSVIARIVGVGPDPGHKGQVMILGAHQDSINMAGGDPVPAPGADDDASGSAVLVETLRVLLQADFASIHTLEFHWYAGEEGGLRGSQDIAQDYKAHGVDVVSMMQFDVVGHFVGRREIGVVTDFTDPQASQFLRKIIDEYCAFKWTNTRCGYGCSDHASWFRAGYPTAMPVEVVLHPFMHTMQDTSSTVNYEQVLEFAKAAVGHTVELGFYRAEE